MKRRQWLAVIAVGSLVVLPSCKSRGARNLGATGEAHVSSQAKLYTAYNLWYEKPSVMFAINYPRGAMIPAGTEVSKVRVHHILQRPTITFKTASDGRSYRIYFRKKFFPGVRIHDLKDRLFSTQSFQDQVKGLTPREVEAIRAGKLVEGMSREAVLVARGYPPTHRTPSLEGETWLYWESRMVNRAVHFDASGRTSWSD